MNFEVSDATILQIFKMRAAQDSRVKDLLESISWEAVAMEQQAKLQALEGMAGRGMDIIERGPDLDVLDEVANDPRLDASPDDESTTVS